MAEPDQKRKKFHFLPEAHNDRFVYIPGVGFVPEEPPAPAPEPEPELPVPGTYPCPCCGFLTFPVPKEQAVAYICPVCFWENDVFDPNEDDPSDENGGMTLREGRENYLKFGAAREDLAQYTRQPKPEETPM